MATFPMSHFTELEVELYEALKGELNDRGHLRACPQDTKSSSLPCSVRCSRVKAALKAAERTHLERSDCRGIGLMSLEVL